MKRALFQLAAAVPASWWEQLAPENCLLPYYHMVADVPRPHVSPLYAFRTVREFEADLDYFLRRRRAISLAEFVDAVRAAGAPPAGTFLVTFDDGFREMHDVVTPILERKGVPGVFFLNTATLDNRALGHHQKIALLLDRLAATGPRFPAAEVRARLLAAGRPADDLAASLRALPWRLSALADELAGLAGLDCAAFLRTERPYVTSEDVHDMLRRGMSIGAHSIDHPLYADLTLEEQLHQTRESMADLARRFALSRRAFAFPHTDRRVSRDFFDAILRDGTAEVAFGTAGPLRDSVPGSFQRFSMEKPLLPAALQVGRLRLRRLKQRVTGRTVIPRAPYQPRGSAPVAAGTT